MKNGRIVLLFAALIASLVWTSAALAQRGSPPRAAGNQLQEEDDGGGAGLTVSPASLTFNAVVSGAAPPSQNLLVSAANPTSVTVRASSYSDTGRNWLTVSPSGGITTNRTLKVSVNPVGLAAGTYSGRVSLTANGSTQAVRVAFVVAAVPPTTLTVSPSSLSFAYQIGGTTPAAQTLTVSGVASTFTAAASGGTWLTATAATGSVSVRVSTTGLAAGIYNGSVTITAAGSTGSPKSVPVTFNVTAATPTLTVSPSSLSFAFQIGGTAPAAQTLTVSGVASTFTAAASGGTWLTATAAAGSVSVRVSTTGLAAGTYNGSVTVTAAGSTGSPKSVPVTFNVTATTSTLTVTPSSLTFAFQVGGTTPAAQTLTVSGVASTFTAAASGGTWLTATAATGSASVRVSTTGLAAGRYNGSVTITAAGSTGSPKSVPVTFNVSSATTSAGPFKVIGWNDLGMHCMDGKDFSVFSVLPPYNTIHAHLVDLSGSLVTVPAGYTITYQAVTDPLTNTLNSSSFTKTNFWQYAASLFGLSSLANDVGLKGYAMPGAANTPQAMTFNTPDNTWVATGIPITNTSDSGTTNYFPMMRLTAKNAAGAVLATTDIVLPISDELSCGVCHASATGTAAALPAGGGVNNSDPAKDMKFNILRKHDQRFASLALFQSAATQVGYNPAGLEATVTAASTGKPVLCDNCHGSTALSMSGVAGIPPLTTAIHGLHASAIDPATSQTMDSATTRDTCYRCHPGPNTKCLRGVMGNYQATPGTNAIECQSCHGSMSNVATATRTGWLDEPNCQACHAGTAVSNPGQIVYTSVFTSTSPYTMRVPTDQTFATNADTPAAGISLYRFSNGHGGLQCEACHGSTHAEFDTNNVNDNLQSTNLQGHVGALAECATCHTTVPTTTNGGPHGLHPIGSTWVSRHQNVADSGGTTACQACHGTDYRGTILSKTQSDETLAGHTFPRGTIIGCYSCHNGPGGG
jgi:hypothetical protein